MRRLFFFILVSSCLSSNGEIESTEPSSTVTSHPGTYLITAPKVIRPGLPYAISVNILRSSEEKHTVRLEIRTTGNVTVVSQTVKGVKKRIPQVITLPNRAGDQLTADRKYKIYVRGETEKGRKLFEEEKPLSLRLKSTSTFIQTDKGIYKPGQVINYRVLNVSPELLPINGSVSVRIIDPNKNIIKQQLDQPLVKGVFVGQLELASEPPLGDWTIQATSKGGQKYEKSFTVDQYILPKFEVTVRPPPFTTTKENLPILVEAKYTYGKGVAGKVTVVVEPMYPPWPPETDEDGRVTEASVYKIERTTTLLNGKATVTFDNGELLKHGLLHEYSEIKVTAKVVEGLTGVERNGTASLYPHAHAVKLEVEKMGDSYKPGLPYNVLVSLKYQDDTPVKADVNKMVEITTIYYYPYDENVTAQPEIKKTEVIQVDGHGTKMITVRPPLNATSGRIEARYDPTGRNNFTDLISGTAFLDASKSPSSSFIQVRQKNTDTVRAGEKMSFTIKTTERLPAVIYQVMSRGSMVLSKQLKMTSLEGTVTFSTTSQMAPKSRLVVYAVRNGNQEILVDATDFRVDGIFQNKVSLSIDTEEAEPGTDVSFKVRADPHSYVGLLAVDQSILLLKAGNDITEELITGDLEDYDATGYSNDYAEESQVLERKKRSIWWWGIGGQDAAGIFENSGLLVLTDAYLHEEPMPKIMPMIMEAEAMAFAAPPAQAATGGFGGNNAAPPRLRTKFPETWIWTGLDSGEDGEVNYSTTAPDTITSWITSAFAVSEKTGLGIASESQKLRVFRPFFIRLELPYSVKEGEKFALQVLVFNYMDGEQEVTVTLAHDKHSGFDFMSKDGTVRKSREEEDGRNRRIVTVPGGGASKAVYFPIIPRIIGDVPLHVTAISSAAGDAVQQPLKVEPEGYRVDRNVPLVLTPNGNDLLRKRVAFNWPNDTVDGSRRARFEVVGDIMGPVLANLDGLVRMPFGCGEQNMLNFVPNIVVMKYLQATRRKDPQLEAKAKRFMEAGYQRELTYKRSDDSFSAFGESDKAGSTWLTAFVVRSFTQAKPFIYVDENVLKKSIAFLNSQQMESGAFAENGEIHHKDMQGGASEGGVGLTAYVTLALLENGIKNQAALSYLEKELSSIGNDSYTLAVTTYALHLAGSRRKEEAIQALMLLKIANKDGSDHWTSKKGGAEEAEKKENWYFFQPRPVDVETTAYSLLSVMLENQTDTALPIVRWLTSQRNSLGGFSSTQDTVIALQALAAYAEAMYSPGIDASVSIKTGKDSHSFTVNSENSIVLQSYELSNLDSPLTVQATGKGTAFAQLSYSYYRNTLKDEAPFSCSQKVKELRGGKRLQLELCCHYNRPGQSNMAVAEVSTLSGYQFDREELQYLTSTPGIQRTEYEKDDTKINIYLNPLGEEDVCFMLVSDLVHSVTDHKPAQIHLFDYYNPQDQLKSTYTSGTSKTLKDFCLDCWK